MPGEAKECGGCGAHGLLAPLFDMGMQPVPEGARAGKRYPLKLVRCENCGLVQLSYAVDPAELFPKDHPYSTGNSAALREHYEDLARTIAGTLHTGDVVVDIGANDGTLLNGYPDGLRKIAVEPTDQGRKFKGTYYPFFFTEELARKIVSQYGPAKVITAMNVLAHVPDVHDFLDGVAVLLDDDGVFITENHDLHSITSGLQLDAIYHEHLRYYTAGTLCRLLEQHGFRVASSLPVPTHGGSFRVTAHKTRQDFPERARMAATALRGMLYQFTRQRQKVYGIGATTRATPLIHYAGISDFITCVCEVPGSDKIGQNMPGTSIPVVDEAVLLTDQPAYALLLNWHLAADVVPKLRAAGYKGKFLVPLPEPKVLDA
jgi:hypothetical protein